MQKEQKVFVAMSGGVDSSVAAYLLTKHGFDAAGVYLQVWSDKDDLADCPWQDEIESAAKAADQIGIPFRSLHIEEEYQKKVVDYLIDGYKRGITPNPDIMCNREIKFGIFLDWAMKQGADYVATGHYVRKLKIKNAKLKITIQNSKLNNNQAIGQSDIKFNQHFKLLKGKDENKDQSYFLYTLTQRQLSKIIFPIGDLTKPEVRKIAKKAGLPNWDRKDSQGICFIGKVQLPKFLQQYIKPKKGAVMTVDGKQIGEHNGVFYYTIGQRHGLDLGSKTESDAYYIAEKRLDDNVIIVARGRDNSALYAKELICDNVNWIAGMKRFRTSLKGSEPFKCAAKIRYRQKEEECKIRKLEIRNWKLIKDLKLKIKNSQDAYLVKFQTPQFAVAPGQSIVFYQGDECLGGGVIYCETLS